MAVCSNVLTSREIEIMEAFLDPHSTYYTVAQSLFLAENTVKCHLQNAYVKLGETSLRPAIASFLRLYPEYLPKALSFYETHEGAALPDALDRNEQIRLRSACNKNSDTAA